MAKMNKRAADRKPWPTPVPGSQANPPTDPKDPLRIQDLGNSTAYQRDAGKAGLTNMTAVRNAQVATFPNALQGPASYVLSGFNTGSPVLGSTVSMQGQNFPKTVWGTVNPNTGGAKGGAARKSATARMKKRASKSDERDAMRESAPAAPMPKKRSMTKGQGAYTEYTMTKGKKKAQDSYIIDPALREEAHAVGMKRMAKRNTYATDSNTGGPRPTSIGSKGRMKNTPQTGLWLDTKAPTSMNKREDVSNVGAAPPGWFGPGGQGTIQPRPKPSKRPIPVPRPIKPRPGEPGGPRIGINPPKVPPITRPPEQPPIYGDDFPNRPKMSKMAKRSATANINMVPNRRPDTIMPVKPRPKRDEKPIRLNDPNPRMSGRNNIGIPKPIPGRPGRPGMPGGPIIGIPENPRNRPPRGPIIGIPKPIPGRPGRPGMPGGPIIGIPENPRNRPGRPIKEIPGTVRTMNKRKRGG